MAVTRPTKDIDLFTEVNDHEARQVVAALRCPLKEQDIIEVTRGRPATMMAGFLHRHVRAFGGASA